VRRAPSPAIAFALHLGACQTATRGVDLCQPFGGKRSALPSNLSGWARFKYAGQILEESNGLYWMSARYYDAAFGRFAT
jgi:hypothetical protein